MKNKNQPEEERCVKAFVRGYSDIKGSIFNILEWPDQNNPGDIDALASDGNDRLAIEHTSIDSFEKQREDDAVFSKVFSPISNELNGQFEGRVTIVVPIKAVLFQKDQEKTVKDLKKLLEDKIPSLPYGKRVIKSSSLNFEVKVLKEKSEKKLIGFARPAPESLNIEKRLKEAIVRKAKKFLRKKYQHETKILLIENNDIALVSPVDFRKAWGLIYRQGIKSTFDQVWYVDSSIPSEYYLHPLFSQEKLNLEKEYKVVKIYPEW